MFGWFKVGGVVKQQVVVPVAKPQPAWRPGVGEMVTLREGNPYKGSLRFGESYEVVDVFVPVIRLRADNGTLGYFHIANFEPYTGFGKRMPMDASAEYEEALAAQEIMEGFK